MTKEELKALVASKLEGQGNQVDVGGALSVILNELIDGMGGGSGGGEWKYLPYEVLQQEISEMSLSEFLTQAGWTREEFESLARGKYAGIFYDISLPEHPVIGDADYHLAIVSSSFFNLEGQYGAFIIAGKMTEDFGATMEILAEGSSYEDATVTITWVN